MSKVWRHEAHPADELVLDSNITQGLRLGDGWLRADEVCAAFPAITGLGKGYDAYVAVDTSGTFSETKRQAGLLRMQQATLVGQIAKAYGK